MLRTQIYLPHNQLKLLKKMAWEEEISLSEAIRRLINEKLVEAKKVDYKQNSGSWLLGLADKAKKLKIKGPKDLASKMDFYLYMGKSSKLFVDSNFFIALLIQLTLLTKKL